MKIFYLLVTVLITLVANQTLAQNPAWSLPPFFRVQIAPVSSLPTNTNPGYQGDTAVAASNMQLDAKGNILFFVVDGVVYKGDGSHA